jgi:hypothetical protein
MERTPWKYATPATRASATATPIATFLALIADVDPGASPETPWFLQSAPQKRSARFAEAKFSTSGENCAFFAGPLTPARR